MWLIYKKQRRKKGKERKGTARQGKERGPMKSIKPSFRKTKYWTY